MGRCDVVPDHLLQSTSVLAVLLRAHSRRFIEEVKITCTKGELEKLSNDELDRIAAGKSLAAACALWTRQPHA